MINHGRHKDVPSAVYLTSERYGSMLHVQVMRGLKHTNASSHGTGL
jgi:hypothetical protein